MQYSEWRNHIFGQPSDAHPVLLDLPSEVDRLDQELTFDHVDCALADPEIHTLFDPDQIGIGLQLMYENSCSNICFCYTRAGDDARRVAGIRKLRDLYVNFFDRYCVERVRHIGNDHLNGRIGYLCYMFWDVFILYPGNASPAMVAAALEVMDDALHSKNDNCIVSALHGLGHWVGNAPAAGDLVRRWLDRPTTVNAAILEYAKLAAKGCVL
ncbi:MAG: hypothetical protein H7A47_04630 [Verrucomicrobiales bacterium]|nr:hypothetical protein [Verrucomicrobiales bacterium]